MILLRNTDKKIRGVTMDQQSEQSGKIYFFEKESIGQNSLTMMHNTDEASYISRRHYHRSVEIGLMIRGSAGYIVNEHIETINSGDISYIDSWDVHYFDIKKGNETYTVIIGTEYLRDFYNTYGDSDSTPYFDQALRNREVNRRILKLLQEWEQKYDESDVLTNIGYINLIFAELVKGYPVRLRKHNRQEMSAVNAVLEYINSNYQKDISLQDVAKALGYGTSYCSKIFHEYIDQDFRNYVNGVRIEAARRMMLENPEKRVTDIAYDCGFGSLNTFYRAYKRIFKKSPRRN